MDLTDIIGVSDSDKILISQHAKNRMFERSINLEDILSCLAECDIPVFDSCERVKSP